MEFEMQFVEMETGLKVGGSKYTNNKAWKIYGKKTHQFIRSIPDTLWNL